VVDLVGLQLVNQPRERDRIAQVAVVGEDADVLIVRIAIEVVDPVRVEARGPADDPMHLVALVEQ
jgi:hypothetical protein